jgi:hypothetical protein
MEDIYSLHIAKLNSQKKMYSNNYKQFFLIKYKNSYFFLFNYSEVEIYQVTLLALLTMFENILIRYRGY